MVSTNQAIFSKEIEGLGVFEIRPIQLETDIETVYNWVSKPYAKYWGMNEQSLEEVHKAYKEIEDDRFHQTYIGMLNGAPVFLTERYKASEDILANYYDAKPYDYGMHVLVAPVETKISQFTWHVFSTIIEYFFSLSFVDRVVVEPDIHNEKIHVLNRKAGFVYDKEIQLPEKKAALAFCTRKSYKNALSALNTIKS